jgi:signal transduction histidine kinase
MSDIVWAVNPRNDRLEDLARRMRELASEVSSARGLQMGFHAAGMDGHKLGPDVRRHAYLVFKEAVSNAARHARASRIDVDLSVHAGRLVLRVADDGCGFETSGTSDGNGLTTMTRRATELGGRTEIVSRPGEGTVVTLDVPLGW